MIPPPKSSPLSGVLRSWWLLDEVRPYNFLFTYMQNMVGHLFPPGGGVLSHLGYIGMCGPKG